MNEGRIERLKHSRTRDPLYLGERGIRKRGLKSFITMIGPRSSSFNERMVVKSCWYTGTRDHKVDQPEEQISNAKGTFLHNEHSIWTYRKFSNGGHPVSLSPSLIRTSSNPISAYTSQPMGWMTASGRNGKGILFPQEHLISEGVSKPNHLRQEPWKFYLSFAHSFSGNDKRDGE